MLLLFLKIWSNCRHIKKIVFGYISRTRAYFRARFVPFSVWNHGGGAKSLITYHQKLDTERTRNKIDRLCWLLCSQLGTQVSAILQKASQRLFGFCFLQYLVEHNNHVPLQCEARMPIAAANCFWNLSEVNQKAATQSPQHHKSKSKSTGFYWCL